MPNDVGHAPRPKYLLTPPEQAKLENDFVYHPPFGDQAARYQDIRDGAAVLTGIVLSHCPPSAERTLAQRKIQEAMMWANASIALNEQPDRPTTQK